jgi:tetratricopeptide (TPR) repeat protein
LEGELAGYFEQNKDSSNKKYLACFELSKAITLTINRVQETYPNWFDGTNDTDINTLYQYFLQGYKLNWTKFKECGNSLVHVRSEYFEIEAPVTTGKIVDDINSPEKSISITDYLTQGNELLEAGQIQEAIASLLKAVDSNPSSAWPYYYLGLALDKDGQFEGSVSEFGRAIALDPDLIWAHHYLGETLVKLGRLEEAVGSLNARLN